MPDAPRHMAKCNALPADNSNTAASQYTHLFAFGYHCAVYYGCVSYDHVHISQVPANLVWLPLAGWSLMNVCCLCVRPLPGPHAEALLDFRLVADFITILMALVCLWLAASFSVVWLMISSSQSAQRPSSSTP